METAQIMELMERRIEKEREWVTAKKELYKCGKCLKMVTDRIKTYQKRINDNNDEFENSLTDGSVFIKDPRRVNEELKGMILDLRNGKALPTCSDECEKKAILVNEKLTMVVLINNMLEKVS